ncbi:NfeD family protein [Parasegetibacter sp. NRK P23]|uniref:NfeD family protein n=1 Tax=Parasegetibacter sp. NRK P23 TaxID=2942999 RepID=UPI002044AA9C|nr:NfeD family protein [Parasegetibacter sp. NRK P23]MCM5529331.1 NfeD family protein [Parasegetibacter sp. NRK P23]
MEVFQNIAVIWFFIGLVLFLLEFALPGFILFFFGTGAWIVAIIALFTDISLNTQLIIFLGSSLLNVLLFRNWIRTKLGMGKKSPQALEDEFIGQSAKAETPITPGTNGKVTFRGTSWEASSNDTIAAGENVIITGNKSILLIVRSTQTI